MEICALGVTGPFRAGVGHLPGANSHGQAAVGRGVQGQGGARSRVDSLSGRGFSLGQRERLSSESKRSYAEMVSGDQPESEGGQFQYQGRRQPRKVNYGKSNVNIAGGEAAPYEVFIGNTNPGSTEEIIKEILEKTHRLFNLTCHVVGVEKKVFTKRKHTKKQFVLIE